MTLLNDIMEKSMDNSYELAQKRREQLGVTTSNRTWLSATLIVLMSAIVGLILVWGTSHLRISDDSGSDAREILYTELMQRREAHEELSDYRESLKAEILSLQASDSSVVGQELLRRSAELATWSGTTAVQGEGIILEVSDGPLADPLAPGFDEARIHDIDLQLIVNSLRASGAEAIAINGNRLTSTTAIRSAGAILVDLQPILSPYQITAIGNPDELKRNFSTSAGAQQLNFLAVNYNIKHTIETAQSLELPAGRATSRFVEATEQ